MTTFHLAVDDFTALRKVFSWFWPSIVRFGLLIASRHACETGLASEGTSAEKTLRTLCGAVGARSGSPGVDGLSQTPLAEALALRNERSSRKKSSRFLPQRSVR